MAKYLLDKGVKGLYVGGSSGECIYQSVAERKETLENVMSEVGGKLTIIAHVACNNTADSCELAAHAERLGVDLGYLLRPFQLHLNPMGVVGEHHQKIAGGQGQPIAGAALVGVKVIVLYPFKFLQLSRRGNLYPFGSIHHNMDIQVFPVGLEKALFLRYRSVSKAGEMQLERPEEVTKVVFKVRIFDE